MRILHVITGMQKAAGTTTFVENVVRGLREHNLDVDIVMSPEDFQKCDIIHIHGLWSGLLHKAVRFAIRNNIPIVWSTHGMTAPWAMRHKRWKKIPAWLLYQKWDLMKSSAIHCTTEQEVEWNKSLGYDNCFVAPLGTNEGKIRQALLSAQNANSHILLFVGRIYPVKGLSNLLSAWASCKIDGWQLRIVGPDQEGHKAELELLVKEHRLSESVVFTGPKYGSDLSAEYENCDCLVLPSFTENFGATVVDALAHGKPCIASTFTPWRELAERGCGWWVSNKPKELSKTINTMMRLSDHRRKEMGSRGRSLVEEKYTWGAVCGKIMNEYLELAK